MTKCNVCKEQFDASNLAVEHRYRLETVGICPPCDFWAEKWANRQDRKNVRINGQHYRLSRAGAMFTQSGRFRIRYNDGREVVVTGLSNQGRIPRTWAGVLEDNAAFVREIEVQHA